MKEFDTGMKQCMGTSEKNNTLEGRISRCRKKEARFERREASEGKQDKTNYNYPYNKHCGMVWRHYLVNVHSGNHKLISQIIN